MVQGVSDTVAVPPDLASPGSSPRAVHPRPDGTSVCGVDVMCQRIRDGRLPQQITQFITSSIRWSSLKTCESVWESWLACCSTHNVDREAPNAPDSSHYLWFLFWEKELAPAMLGVTTQSFLSPAGGQFLLLLAPSVVHEGNVSSTPSNACNSSFLLGRRSCFAILALMGSLGASVPMPVVSQIFCLDSDLFLQQN